MKAQTLVPLAAAAAAQLLVVGNIAAAFAFQQKPPVETLVTVPVVAEIEQVECVRQDPVPYEPVTYQVPLDAELQSYTEKMCDLYDVPLELAYAVMQVESGFTPAARSSTGDYGLIEYYSYEPVGFADVIANYASDLPRVDVKGTPHRAEIVNIGDSYGYNVQELRACRRNAVLGIMKSLDSARAEAARRVYDVKVNHLIWHGDEKTGIIGVLSSGNNIPIYTLQNGAAGKADWASKTADEIAADIAGILNYIDTLTQNVEHPDSWVMPNDLYTSLNLRRIDGTGESVLSYIKDHTPQIKNWEVAGELSKGNKDYNSTGKNIGLLYTKDSDKMSHEVPMAFLQHAPQDCNLEIVINCEGRDAGMMIP